jgi:ketosteroid isomerase-like protein
MAGISFFADEHDAVSVIERLNADPEIAFIIPDGPMDPEEALVARMRAAMGDRTEATFYVGVPDDGYRQRWRAVPTVERLEDGIHSLWHVPSGSLPLLTPNGGPSQAVPDPWAGWVEQQPGAERRIPYFGGYFGEISLDLAARHRPYTDAEKATLRVISPYLERETDLLIASDFKWYGSHRSPWAQPMRRWQDRFKAWVRRTATDLGTGRYHIWAFPSALEKLKGGMDYFACGQNLGAQIQAV